MTLTAEGNAKFDSTGRIMLTHSCGDTFSLSSFNDVMVGHDSYLGDWEEDDLTVEEKTELADYMIKKWQNFAKQ